jgi:hypothetical protein
MKLFLIFIFSLELIFFEFSSSQTPSTDYNNVTDQLTTEGNSCTAQGKFYFDLA